ncbi:glycosyltransferase [Candidatus Dojkabacteria bacterium]|nr:glycosyltransferase [Candidatus Dojkabacteria bacterium]
MRILFLSWYDRKNPASGGAEKLSYEILKRLCDRGHEVTWFAHRYRGSSKTEVQNGISVVRRGTRVGTVFAAFLYYLKNFRAFDLVVDNFHAFSFLTSLYVKKSRRIAMIYEVAGKEIWFKMMYFPLNLIGLLLEKFLLGSLYAEDRFITISNSTKVNLVRNGIDDRNIRIVPMGISQKPLEKLPQKTEFPSLVYFGGIRRMKRVEDQLEAVNILRKDFPRLKFYILGRNQGSYYEFLKKKVWELRLDNFVEFVGFLPDHERDALISRSWLNLGTSVKEGWGLVVNESNALGTPTVAYNVYGFRDSIKHYKNGLLTITRTPDSLATAAKRLFLDKDLYEKLQLGGLKDSKKFSFDDSADEFEKIVYEKLYENVAGSQIRDNFGMDAVVNLSRQELVSVIIPVLNSEKFLERCLESVKKQTYKNIEIIVVDGGSKDNSVKIAKQFGAKVLKWVDRGRSAQKNRGAKVASGKYLYFIDDDLVLNGNIVKSAVMSIKERGYDMIAVHNVSDSRISYWAKIRKFERDFLEYDTHNISPRFLTKKAFEKVEGFDEALIAAEDYDIYNRLREADFRLGFITEKELHLGEPRTIKDIINKYYFYGKTMVGEKRRSGGKLAELTFAQKSPIKPAYLRKFYRFILRPDLALGVLFYNSLRFSVAGIGYLMGKLKKKEDKDRVFRT